MNWNPPASGYQPPDPPEDCCHLYEEDENHDVQACLDAQAEDAAEARAERDREDMMEARFELQYLMDDYA